MNLRDMLRLVDFPYAELHGHLIGVASCGRRVDKSKQREYRYGETSTDARVVVSTSCVSTEDELVLLTTVFLESRHSPMY